MQAGPDKAEQPNELGSSKERHCTGLHWKTSEFCELSNPRDDTVISWSLVCDKIDDCLSRLRGQHRIREAAQFHGAGVDMSPTWEAPDMHHMKQGDKSDLIATTFTRLRCDFTRPMSGADMDRVQRVIGRLEAGTRVRPSLLVAGTRMSRM